MSDPSGSGPSREVHYIDYVALAVLWVVAVAKGVWQAMCQAPTYYHAQWRSCKSRVEAVQKKRADGLTQRERWLESIKPDSNKNSDQDE